MGMQEYMERAEDTWRPMVARLEERGLPASVWQTGGGCLAIGVAPPEQQGCACDDPYIMLTGEEGPLSVDGTYERELVPDKYARRAGPERGADG